MKNNKIRVYIFPTFTDKLSNERRVLLGREEVLHLKALWEMRTILSKHRAQRQCAHLKSLLEKSMPVLDRTTGRVLGNGPFQGGNFGGVLLIGRPAPAGGRVEKSDASIEEAGIREMVEEFRIEARLLEDKEIVQLIKDKLELVCTIDRPASQGVVEHYYTLDIDSFVGTDVLKYLDPEDIVDLFDCPSLVSADDDDNDKEPAPAPSAAESNLEAARAEKRSVYAVPLSELKAQFGDRLGEEDRIYMLRKLELLAATVCELVQAAGCEKECARQLLAFQESRNMRTAAIAADKLAEFYAKKQENEQKSR